MTKLDALGLLVLITTAMHVDFVPASTTTSQESLMDYGFENGKTRMHNYWKSAATDEPEAPDKPCPICGSWSRYEHTSCPLCDGRAAPGEDFARAEDAQQRRLSRRTLDEKRPGTCAACKSQFFYRANNDCYRVEKPNRIRPCYSGPSAGPEQQHDYDISIEVGCVDASKKGIDAIRDALLVDRFAMPGQTTPLCPPLQVVTFRGRQREVTPVVTFRGRQREVTPVVDQDAVVTAQLRTEIVRQSRAIDDPSRFAWVVTDKRRRSFGGYFGSSTDGAKEAKGIPFATSVSDDFASHDVVLLCKKTDGSPITVRYVLAWRIWKSGDVPLLTARGPCDEWLVVNHDGRWGVYDKRWCVIDDCGHERNTRCATEAASRFLMCKSYNGAPASTAAWSYNGTIAADRCRVTP